MEKNEIILPNEEKEKKEKEEDKLALAKEEDQKILSKTFFKKYKPLERLSQGSNSVIYEGINTENNERIAI